MSDEGTDQEPGSLSGDVVPAGPGAWMSYTAAGGVWKIKPKAVYRRITRGKAVGRKNPETGEPEVWVSDREEPSSDPPPSVERTHEEPRSLTVPDAPERFARLIAESNERATAPLVARIEELIRENEQLRREKEQRSWRSWLRSLLGYN